MFTLRIFLMAYRGLRANLLRSFLATFGVIIGVSAVVAAMSILEGADRQIRGRFESMGADQVYVVSGSSQRQSRHAIKMSLTPADAEALSDRRDCPLVKAVAPELQLGAQTVQYFDRNRSATVLATTADYAVMNNYQADAGRFLTLTDVRSDRKVCVLGHKIADELFGHLPAIGQRIKIKGVAFTVVGVMEKKGFLGMRQVDDQVVIPLTTGMKRLFRTRYVHMINVQSEKASQLDDCIAQIKRVLRREHRIRPGSDDDFTIFTVEQAKVQVAWVTNLFGIVLYSIAGIALAVGGIGIMNIMLVSVTERTREIGVRMAVGARRGDILKQFLIEANVISILGGGLGVLLGLVFTSLLEDITGVLKTHTDSSIIIWALGMAIVVGVTSGLYPAVRASRLDPVEALRYE